MTNTFYGTAPLMIYHLLSTGAMISKNSLIMAAHKNFAIGIDKV